MEKNISEDEKITHHDNVPENVLNYIRKTMLNSYRYSWETMKVTRNYYYQNWSLIFNKILENANCSLCYSEDELLKGFSVWRADLLYFVYTRNFMRSQGLGTKLIKHLVLTNGTINCAFLTKDFHEKIGPKIKYNYHPMERYRF